MRRTVFALLATVLPAVVQAQEPAPANCGLSLRRPTPQGADGDSLVRVGSVLQMERMTNEMRVRGGGRVQIGAARGWVGIHTSEMSEMRLTPEGRVVRYCDYPVVTSVEPSSPAAKAGVEAMDTIIAYNGADLRSAGEVALDRMLVPGDTLRVSVRRGGRTLVAPVVVGRAPENLAMGGPSFSYVIVGPGRSARGDSVAMVEARLRPSARRTMTPGAASLLPSMPIMLGFGLHASAAIAGAQLMTMDDDLREVVRARSNGILVLKVGEGTPARESGLRSGDVIVLAGGVAVNSPLVLQQAIERSREDRMLVLKVERDRKSREVRLRW